MENLDGTGGFTLPDPGAESRSGTVGGGSAPSSGRGHRQGEEDNEEEEEDIEEEDNEEEEWLRQHFRLVSELIEHHNRLKRS